MQTHPRSGSGGRFGCPKASRISGPAAELRVRTDPTVTPELQNRWQTARAPFNESVLLTTDLLPLSLLRTVTFNLVEKLLTADALLAFEDWHEHDGYLTSAKQTARTRLTTMLSTDATLLNARSGEAYVHLGFLPLDHAWLLRIYVLEPDEDDQYPGCWGEFSLSGSAALCAAARQLAEVHTELVDVLLAKPHFDRTYAG